MVIKQWFNIFFISALLSISGVQAVEIINNTSQDIVVKVDLFISRIEPLWIITIHPGHTWNHPDIEEVLINVEKNAQKYSFDNLGPSDVICFVEVDDEVIVTKSQKCCILPHVQ